MSGGDIGPVARSLPLGVCAPVWCSTGWQQAALRRAVMTCCYASQPVPLPVSPLRCPPAAPCCSTAGGGGAYPAAGHDGRRAHPAVQAAPARGAAAAHPHQRCSGRGSARGGVPGGDLSVVHACAQAAGAGGWWRVGTMGSARGCSAVLQHPASPGWFPMPGMSGIACYLCLVAPYTCCHGLYACLLAFL